MFPDVELDIGVGVELDRIKKICKCLHICDEFGDFKMLTI